MLGHNKAFSRDSGVSTTGSNSTPSSANTINVTSGEVLGYPRAVMLVSSKAYLFQPATAVWNSLLGITTQSVLANVSTPIITSGLVTYAGWGLVPNQVQYANANGIISNLPLAGVGNMQPIGIAIDTDTLLLKDLNSIDVV